MSDKILSQSEIEALMSNLALDQDDTADGAASAQPELTKSVKLYDFRRPDKFSKEHLRALRILHGTFSRALASSLSSSLRTNLQVRLTMVEQVTYDEYIRSLPSPTVLFIMDLAPLPGQAVLELNHAVARPMLDRLLGGSGVVTGRTRDLTEIELTLLRMVGGLLANALKEAWAEVLPLEPIVQDPVLSPEFVQVTLSSETTAMLVFELGFVRTTGTLSLCIPHPVLQPVMDKVTSQVWFTGSSRSIDEETHLNPLEELQQVSLPISVDLGGADISVREMLNLAVGQVIKLDTTADGSLPIRVGEHVKFGGRPGAHGKNLAVQVTHTFN